MGESSNNGQRERQNQQNNGYNHHNNKSFHKRHNGRLDKDASNGGKNGAKPASETTFDDGVKPTIKASAVAVNPEKEAEKRMLEEEYGKMFVEEEIIEEVSEVVTDADNDADDVGDISDIPVFEHTRPKKIVKNDEDMEFYREKQEEEPEFSVDWLTHDSEKELLSVDFHRGSKMSAENFVVGDSVMRHGRCKLDTYDWLKDFETVKAEGELCVAEVRFKNDRKDFFSYPAELNLSEGELVAVEAAIGHDIGIVTLVGPIVDKQRERKGHVTPVTDLKKIYRRARVNDVEKFFDAMRLEKHTLYRSREIAVDLNLDMKLNDIEYQGDKTKAIFYYTADGRVDFRELIKKLAEEFHVRVEMRQIGFRQEAAKLGGVGSCGRELCCASWITEFQSVTTNIARIQQLSPNPQKLAGQCGKLKCCLNYEYNNYVEALKSFPDHRISLKTQKGEARFQKYDIFKGLMWYSYVTDRSSMMAIPVEKVKEIMAENKEGILPEQLEDYAFIKEQKNADYGEEGRNVDLKKLE